MLVAEIGVDASHVGRWILSVSLERSSVTNYLANKRCLANETFRFQVRYLYSPCDIALLKSILPRRGAVSGFPAARRSRVRRDSRCPAAAVRGGGGGASWIAGIPYRY